MRGRKPKPTRIKLLEGNPGKRPVRGDEPKPPGSLSTCPAHLSPAAKAEWKRLARSLNRIGVLTQVDRVASYCQSWGRWVEAERKLADTPVLLKTPAGYVQQSPWLAVSNKQLELMAKFMAELGLTPSPHPAKALEPGGGVPRRGRGRPAGKALELIGMGRPPHTPTPSDRRQVEAMAGYGVPEAHIARVLGIDPKTLRKHYRRQARQPGTSSPTPRSPRACSARPPAITASR